MNLVTRALAATACLLVLAATPAAAQPPRVGEAGGNILYVGPDGVAENITHTGKDSDPVLSPDGQKIAFVRTEGPAPDEYEPAPASLWIHDFRTGPRKLLAPKPGGDMKRTMPSFNNPVFSLDGGFVYVMTPAWVTSNAIHQVNVKTGAERFVIDGNSLAVVRTGKYRGYLLVERHKYYASPEGGSYDPVDLVRPDGKVILTIPGSADPKPGQDPVAAWLRRHGWSAS